MWVAWLIEVSSYTCIPAYLDPHVCNVRPMLLIPPLPLPHPLLPLHSHTIRVISHPCRCIQAVDPTPWQRY